MRSAVGQAGQAYNQAADTSAKLGNEAQAVGANLTPFETQEMLHPQGYSQQDQSAMLAAGAGGAGGAASALVGQAAQRAGASRNAGGFQAALDDAARMREKGVAGASENMAAENANLKQRQQQAGASGLEHQYGVDTSGMLQSAGQEAGDINAEMNADKYGWIQNWGQIASDVGQSEDDISKAVGMCPARGSLYLMADGSRKKVEEIAVGEKLEGIDGESEMVEKIESADAPILRVITENGFVGRNSRVHAFALPVGGFVVATHALGRMILTEKGPSKVITVEPDGIQTVYNLITDGSHTYQADGLWALGVGEAERHVSMEEWAAIGDKMEGK